MDTSIFPKNSSTASTFAWLYSRDEIDVVYISAYGKWWSHTTIWINVRRIIFQSNTNAKPSGKQNDSNFKIGSGRVILNVDGVRDDVGGGATFGIARPTRIYSRTWRSSILFPYFMKTESFDDVCDRYLNNKIQRTAFVPPPLCAKAHLKSRYEFSRRWPRSYISRIELQQQHHAS